MSEIEVKNLNFSYDETGETLSNVSFAIEKGQYVAIVGHNGSGKSTLAKLLVGLLKPNSGEIIVQGVTLNNKTVKDIRGKISLVFQNPDNQFIGATVEDDIAFGLENRCILNKEMPKLVKEFAQKVGMQEFLNKEPSALSGGQKQRVAIAGALALSPEIIIFDEATSMLDPKGKREILQLIKEMKTLNKDITVVSITHDIEEAYQSDKVIIISQGKIAVEGDPKVILQDEKKMKELHLDVPFVLEMKSKLESIGINVSKYNSLDDIVEAVWQSK
ncbi:MAG: energy-coupling factor transporter ATPase [Bacilli bacterium]|nr:energy-coupling factor transporter ATPase [Bacilli bacterium]